MVNYKLGFYKNGSIKSIDLSKIVVSKSTKLENIDEFTSRFINEKELKLYLLDMGIINESYIEEDLKILYTYNEKIEQLPIVYKLQNKYLDVAFLRMKLKNLSKDIKFLEKLIELYSDGIKYNNQSMNISDIKLYIREVRKNGGYAFYSKLLDFALDDLFIKAITRKNKQQYIINYRSLRKLGLFMYRYEEKQKMQAYKESLEAIKKTQDFSQLNIFDSIKYNEQNNKEFDVNDDDYEPYFPPNSEEERMYNDYMEHLGEMDDESFSLIDLEDRGYKKK